MYYIQSTEIQYYCLCKRIRLIEIAIMIADITIYIYIHIQFNIFQMCLKVPKNTVR